MNAGESDEGQSGGPPAERLREQLEREFGEVPPESPSEPAQGEPPPEDDNGERDEHHNVERP